MRMELSGGRARLHGRRRAPRGAAHRSTSDASDSRTMRCRSPDRSSWSKTRTRADPRLWSLGFEPMRVASADYGHRPRTEPGCVSGLRNSGRRRPGHQWRTSASRTKAASSTGGWCLTNLSTKCAQEPAADELSRNRDEQSGHLPARPRFQRPSMWKRGSSGGLNAVLARNRLLKQQHAGRMSHEIGCSMPCAREGTERERGGL